MNATKLSAQSGRGLMRKIRLVEVTCFLIVAVSLLGLVAREAEAADAAVHTEVNFTCAGKFASYDWSTLEMSIGGKPIGLLTNVAPGTHNLKIRSTDPGRLVKEVKYLDLFGGRGLETYQPNVAEANLPLVFTARSGTSGTSRLEILVETCAGAPTAQTGGKCPDDLVNAHNRLMNEAFYLRGQIALYQARPALFDGAREAIDLGISKLEQTAVDGATKASAASVDDPSWNNTVARLRKASAAAASMRKNLPATSAALIARLEQQRAEVGTRIFQVRDRAEAMGCKLDIPREPPPPSPDAAAQEPRVLGTSTDRATRVAAKQAGENLQIFEYLIIDYEKSQRDAAEDAAEEAAFAEIMRKWKTEKQVSVSSGTAAVSSDPRSGVGGPAINTPEGAVQPSNTSYLVHRDAAAARTFVHVREGSATVTPKHGAPLKVDAGQSALVTANGAEILKAGASGSTTTPPSTGAGIWTPWLNRDAPDGTADWEAYPDIGGSVPCPKPLAVECRVISDKRDYRAAAQRYKCSMDEPNPGGICLNSENSNPCLDYEVRFLCPGGPPGGELPMPPFGTPEPAAVSAMTLQGGQRRVSANELVNVPFFLINAADVANVNFQVRYDVNIARPEGTIGKGNLIDNALLSANPKQSGVLLAGFAQTKGLAGTGTVINVPFRAVGKPGERTRLELIVTTINNTQGAVLKIDRIPGEIAIVGKDGQFPPVAGGGAPGTGGPGTGGPGTGGPGTGGPVGGGPGTGGPGATGGPGTGGPGTGGPGAGGPGAGGPGAGGIVTGDCDGDGRLTALDARCALEMSVQLTPVRIALDIDNSKDITSRDAALILQKAVGR
jgi:hypothetical protein